MQSLAGMQILLVEDHELTLELFTTVLQLEGAHVIAVKTAKAALDVLATRKTDLVVTDVSMPEHDGFWLLREARERRLLEGVPVLAITALGREYAQTLQDAGFDAHLFKPLDLTLLCSTVQVLGRRSGARRSGRPSEARDVDQRRLGGG